MGSYNNHIYESFCFWWTFFYDCELGIYALSSFFYFFILFHLTSFEGRGDKPTMNRIPETKQKNGYIQKRRKMKNWRPILYRNEKRIISKQKKKKIKKKVNLIYK